ncbi:5-(carboxyamino)imidazole ribonucleotide synthase [Desmospora profundinema]|uniref:N5-carboxyaminoimidazole ribonucleotide synthase n=1 Tax=Desmospora profundinema TaxID=1571184 RepID=A0ABU1IM93_9BACL|nr:5-(carboxyamino)imidazole ribonucleotide synthase [Desmospora profundinema]MDR6225863.1 5-(carboxyamino)imidazole ribonucleotide synthase [Desmospora profundinema]
MTTTNKANQPKILLPGSTIGILGGGQLGRMIALEGRRMGYRFITLDPAADCPAAPVSDGHIQASFDDLEAAGMLAEQSDVITYEFENVDDDVVRLLEDRTFVPQGSRLLQTTRHRLREKEALVTAGLPVAPYLPLHDPADLLRTAIEVGFPCVLKTATGGYDGKGQWLLRDQNDAVQTMETIAGGPWVVEAFVPFERELSVIAARSIHGEVGTFSAVENIHRNHILHLTRAPAPVADSILREAEQLAVRVASALNVVGLVAVELFQLADGRLWINELAPRPHNSGHWTYDACTTSQFEQHIRAICGLPLGSFRPLSPAVMVNILGEHLEAVEKAAPRLPASVKLHLYGKRESRPGRKMGHLTVVEESLEQAERLIDGLGIWPSASDEIKPMKSTGS